MVNSILPEPSLNRPGLFRIVCPRCGAVIYESYEERSLTLALRPFNYTCPHCGARLSPREARVRIIPA